MKFKKTANVILTVILVIAGSQLVFKLVDYNASSKLYSEIKDATEETKETTEYEKQNANFKKLKEINNDYKLWITVENTNIDYPVVQTDDNEFYLKRDFNKNKSSAGTIFMDTLNNFMTDRNVVLYGHNMNNKTMFNNLNKFKDKDFFEQNNKIIIKNTGNGKEYIYEVFSVYHTNNNFDYNTVLFNENYTFEQYVNDIKNKSIFRKKMDISQKDKLITLSTCSYEFNGAKTNVHAKLIEVKDLNPNTMNDKIEISAPDENSNSLSIQDMLEY